jgi:hypothetical protein
VDAPGFAINLDLGAMIANKENLSAVADGFDMFCHIHISEPYLKPLEHRTLHAELCRLLKERDYQGYVSIEMGDSGDVEDIKEAAVYIKEVFS